MPDFYHDAIVDRSWQTLQSLNREYSFTLIGGWAAWLHTRSAKSTDIDLIVDFEELSRLRDRFQLEKNDRLKKYEIHADGFDIDIYLPHYSTTLALPAAFILEQEAVIDGFRVPSAEALLALKLGAWRSRRRSVKGQKDLLDIEGLLGVARRSRFDAVLRASGLAAEAQATLQHALTEAQEAIRHSGRWHAPNVDRNFDR